MKITFINHSSIRIRFTSGLDIICDPWYQSRVFNKSWRLLSEEPPELDDISSSTLIYISHEHPDHLNFPTLKTFFKNQYILTANTLRKEIAESCNAMNLGFSRLQPNIVHHLPSGDLIGIFTYYGDSCIYAEDGKTGKSIFNYNDCEFDELHMQQILSTLPSKISLVAGQFGLAGYYANRDQPEIFRKARSDKISRLLSISRRLDADIVLPFASYAVFCKKHNSHINRFQTCLKDVKLSLSSLPANIWIPLPNSTLDLSFQTNQDYLDSVSGLAYWNKLQEESYLDYSEDDRLEFSDLVSAMQSLSERRLKCRILPTVVIQKFYVGMVVRGSLLPLEIDLFRLTVITLPHGHELYFEIPSDELVYAFKHRWGADTLNITGSANVKSLQAYRSFCQILDKILKEVL